ncbi:MAG TPA: hypothetical protein ACFYD4_08375 [Candidatus Wunengus sp. YC61]|uniref:hypothetical protein n=1 Tax=Candidatus Wunengus sp. YC61 TaxID=3367698 RepID=UPI004028FD52
MGLLPNGHYKTAAGSEMRISGAHGGGISEVDFDWLEEGGCCDCTPEPYEQDGRIVWHCKACGGGSARLGGIEMEKDKIIEKEDGKMQCPKCNTEMENKGNVNGVIYTSYPAQWDELYVCDICKTKKSVRVHGHVEQTVDYSAYTEI